MFLALKEWDPYLTTMGDEGGLEVAYKYGSINGRALGHGEPIRVKEGDRVMLRILNASATMHRRIAVRGACVPCDGDGWESGRFPREVGVLGTGTGGTD